MLIPPLDITAAAQQHSNCIFHINLIRRIAQGGFITTLTAIHHKTSASVVTETFSPPFHFYIVRHAIIYLTSCQPLFHHIQSIYFSLWKLMFLFVFFKFDILQLGERKSVELNCSISIVLFTSVDIYWILEVIVISHCYCNLI